VVLPKEVFKIRIVAFALLLSGDIFFKVQMLRFLEVRYNSTDMEVSVEMEESVSLSKKGSSHLYLDDYR